MKKQLELLVVPIVELQLPQEQARPLLEALDKHWEAIFAWKPREEIENYKDGQLCWVKTEQEKVLFGVINDYGHKKVFQVNGTDEGMLGWDLEILKVIEFKPIEEPNL